MNARFDTNSKENLITGTSPVIKAMLSNICDAAPFNVNVIATGPTGAGKELVAQVLHATSERTGPLVSVNCAAIPRDLLEAELFGHEKGAFTGATSRRIGRIEQAQGGTLFLDEIGDMPLDLQAKLLRVIEARVVTRVGSNTETPVDFRLVCATHQNLQSLADRGKFREDLMFRISVIAIRVPPLSERLQDIPELVETIARQMDNDNSGLTIPHIEPCGQAELMRYNWPGNVRELKNFCQRAAVLSRGKSIDQAMVRKLLYGEIDAVEEENTLWNAIAALSEPDDEQDRKEQQHESVSLNDRYDQIINVLKADTTFALKDHIEERERAFISAALELSQNNIASAAKTLSLKRTTLIAKIQKYSLGRSHAE